MSNKLIINQDYDAKCISYSHEGLGICRINEMVVFVNKMLIGETGIVRIKKVKDSFAKGVLISLDNKSEQRVKSNCEHYNMCGGCSLRHMSNIEQNSFKSNLIKQNLSKYGKIDVNSVTVETSPKSNYRNKASFVVSKKNGKLILGFYKKNTHEVINIDSCLINNEMDELRKFVQNVLNETKQNCYNELTNQGNIKHVVFRKSNIGEIQITFVCKDGKLNNEQKLIDKISSRFEDVKSIVINTKKDKNNTILSKNEHTIYGDSFIIDVINDYKFQIGSRSFYQVNFDVMKKIYDYAITGLNLTNDDNLLDAFCGIGTISILSSKFVNKVIGIDANDQSIYYANRNLKMNKLGNVHFINGFVEDVINENEYDVNKVIVDPARKGCDRKFLEFIGNNKNIEMLSYISCNSATLARDLKILIEEFSFKIDKIKGFDMFENTSHVETVVVLSRND